MRTRAMAAGFIALFALFIIAGCVTEQDISAPDNEKVLSAGAEDLDQDSYTDIKRYVFRPIVIDAKESVMMQKSVVAAQTGADLSVKSTKELNDANVSRLITLIYQYDSDRKDLEKLCDDTLGMSSVAGGRCASPSNCASVCSTTACQKYGYASELLGYWIYDYSEDTAALDEEIGDVRNDLIVIDAASPQERELVMRKLNSIIDLTLKVDANPIFSDGMFGVCAPIGYDNTKINEMLSILGEYERQPSMYEYNVVIKFVVSGADYTELNVRDSIPQPLLIALRNLSLPNEGSAYDAGANEIGWPTVKFNLYPDYMIGYSFRSRQGMREDIFENWPTPKISAKVVSLSNSPLLGYIVDTSKYVYSLSRGFGYYPAVAVMLAFWVIAFFLAVLFFKIAISFLGAVFARTSLRDGILRAFGAANPYWKEYAAAALIFFVAGAGMLFAARPVAEDVLSIDNLGKNMIENPLGAGSAIFLFLFLMVSYALLEDRFKGVLAGRRYYEAIIEVSPKANAIRFAKLRESMGELKEKIAGAAGIDVGDEKTVLISVPIDRIQALLKKEGSERAVKELIEVYTEKVEAAAMRVDEKVKISKDYWDEWSREISSKLAERDSVPLSALITIPSEWRAWAAQRFVTENEEEGYRIEAGEIRGSAAGPEKKGADALKKLSSKGLALGGVLLKKDGIETVYSKSGRRTLEAILSWKIANYAKTLGQKVLNSDYAGITIVGAKNAAVLAKFQEREGVVFGPKDKIKSAFEEFQNKLKRL